MSEHAPYVLGGVALGGLAVTCIFAVFSSHAPPPQSAPEPAATFGETSAEPEARLAQASTNDASLDDRIDAGAIVVSHGDSSGVTAADIPIIRAGARMILKTRADCPRVVDSDAVMNEPGRYFVECKGADVLSGHNYFFSRQEVEAATGLSFGAQEASDGARKGS